MSDLTPADIVNNKDVIVYPGPPRGIFRLLWDPCEKRVALHMLMLPLWWARWQVWHWLYEHNFVWGWLNPHPGVWMPYDEEIIDRLADEARTAAEINTAYYLNMAAWKPPVVFAGRPS